MAGSLGSFRELEDKPCSAEIHCMKWSPKMDLLALVTAEGEVWLNRLSWKQVWSVSASNGKAVGIAWRPDGKLLCVGYEGGEMKLFDIENAECVHKCNIGATPTCMEWLEEDKNTKKDVRTQPFNVEKSELYLPTLPFLPKTGGALFSNECNEEVHKDPKKLASLPDELSILTVGDGKGQVHIILYGIFVSGVLDTASTLGTCTALKVISASFSSNLKLLTVVVMSQVSSDSKELLSLMVYDSTLLASHHQELSLVAKKVGSISTLMEYFSETMRSMSEAWEDILLEMDTKLTNFATERLAAGSSVSNEFLTLLTRGTATPELQAFLLHDLTEKGLKKLGHSIENSYSSIQSLALRHLQCVTQALLFHMTEVRGMSKWHDLFGVLGLSEMSTQAAIRSLGSVMLKTRELVEVIEMSLKSFKAFFQWLYSVILRLSDEPVPSYVKQFSQQDVMLVANFLQVQLTTDEHGKFSLERVGQYFEDKPLAVMSSFGDSVWTRFVASSATLRNSPLIMTHKPDESLAALTKRLHQDVDIAFKHLVDIVGESFSCRSLIPLGEATANVHGIFSQATLGTPLCQHIVFALDGEHSQRLHVIKLEVMSNNQGTFGQVASVHVSRLENDDVEEHLANYSIQDAMSYNCETITVLLKEEENENEAETVLAQVPLAHIEDKWYCKFDASTLGQHGLITEMPGLISHDIGPKITHCRKLAGMLSGSITVSGSRKVSCVLSASRRRVKIFDMDAEDEEEEDEDAETSKNENGDSSM